VAAVIVADASLLIAWLDDGDAHHLDAIEVLAAVDRFVVHPLTLAEVLVHPARLRCEGDVLGRLEAIGMVVATSLLDPLALARLRATTNLRMPDCVVVLCAVTTGSEVATFDRELLRALERMRPTSGT
jgi:predicted nucleic acid-binding protein